MSRDRRGDGIQEVVGSIPISSTKTFNDLRDTDEQSSVVEVSNSRLIPQSPFSISQQLSADIIATNSGSRRFGGTAGSPLLFRRRDRCYLPL